MDLEDRIKKLKRTARTLENKTVINTDDLKKKLDALYPTKKAAPPPKQNKSVKEEKTQTSAKKEKVELEERSLEKGIFSRGKRSEGVTNARKTSELSFSEEGLDV